MPGRLLLGVMLALVLTPVLSPVWAGDQGLQAWDRIVPTRFNRLTAADGMANGMVTSVAQDSAGVMWFGTLRMGGAWIDRVSLAFHPVKGISGVDSLVRGRTVRWRTARHRRQEHALAGIVAQRTRELTDANRRLTELAHTDPLTQLLNRRRFIELAEAERERARRTGHPFRVVPFDLDHFKAVNDTFGHHAGDHVLQAACAVIRDGRRTIDVVARYGGEELVALLPGTSAEPALHLAERVGATLATQSIFGDGHAARITTSAGVAEWLPSSESLESLLSRADAALYRAKAEGRNRALLAERRVGSEQEVS